MYIVHLDTKVIINHNSVKVWLKKLWKKVQDQKGSHQNKSEERNFVFSVWKLNTKLNSVENSRNILNNNNNNNNNNKNSTTTRKRKYRKCSKVENSFLMEYYFRSKPSRLGWRKRMLELWNSKGLFFYNWTQVSWSN